MPLSGSNLVRVVRAAGVIAAALLAASAGARAGQPPTLKEPTPLSHVYAVNDTVTFQIKYTDQEQDLPIEAGVQIKSPGGALTTRKVDPADLPNIHDGSTITVTYQPSESGTYEYHFYAKDADGTSSFPDRAELTFKVQPNWLPWVIMCVGVLVSFGIITTLMYQLMHRVFHVPQTAGARVALMIGTICAIVSILYAWDWLTQPLAWLAGGLVILLFAVWALVSR
ncbi:MAG: hypothetical protein LC772_02320 [Chloroflexi bacterium]|nr:hypothetical protein [Chloroflexota bacterium]